MAMACAICTYRPTDLPCACVHAHACAFLLHRRPCVGNTLLSFFFTFPPIALSCTYMHFQPMTGVSPDQIEAPHYQRASVIERIKKQGGRKRTTTLPRFLFFLTDNRSLNSLPRNQPPRRVRISFFATSSLLLTRQEAERKK